MKVLTQNPEYNSGINSNMRPKMRKDGGYTFMVMSSVLIIIALLAAVILSGRDMVRAAKVRAVITQVNNYESAFNTFKMKYHALPGDMGNAAEYWPAECIDSVDNPCNGNMDGQIYPSASEGLRSWQHLGLAKMINGQYAGVLDTREEVSSLEDEGFLSIAMSELFISNAYAKQPKIDICHNGHTINVAQPAVINAHLAHGDTIGSCTGVGGEGGAGSPVATGKFTIGYNIPHSRISGAGYKIDYNDGNLLTFAIERNPYMDGAVISPQEAWNIDSKSDDGVESSGHILTANGYSYDSCIIDGEGYALANDKPVCQMHFWFGE